MRLSKLKKLKNLIENAVNAAVLLALLTHIFTPQITKARPIDEKARIWQEIAEAYDSGKKIPRARVAIAEGLVKKDRPDRVLKAVITAYTSTKDQTDDDPFIAATGKRVHDGMIAANFLPFGTKVKIPALYGDKIFIVEDRMNARYGYGYGRMDIWMDATKAEARKFGVKRIEIEIFYPVKQLAKKK
ncbi:MAG: hypothetical protein AAB348_01515 [Patescibacteria group bacterium]